MSGSSRLQTRIWRKRYSKADFREDLFYRLNVIEIQLPPLRERLEDIPLLAEHFVHRISSELGKDISGISGGALKLLLNHDWPGNVREFENVIESAIVTCTTVRLKSKTSLGCSEVLANRKRGGPRRFSQ